MVECGAIHLFQTTHLRQYPCINIPFSDRTAHFIRLHLRYSHIHFGVFFHQLREESWDKIRCYRWQNSHFKGSRKRFLFLFYRLF